jgi:hypothetical protein
VNEHYPTESNQPTILGFAPVQTIPKVEMASEQEQELAQTGYTAGMSAIEIGRNRPRRSGVLKLLVAKEQSTRGMPKRELLRAHADLQRVLLARNCKAAFC